MTTPLAEAQIEHIPSWMEDYKHAPHKQQTYTYAIGSRRRVKLNYRLMQLCRSTMLGYEVRAECLAQRKKAEYEHRNATNRVLGA